MGDDVAYRNVTFRLYPGDESTANRLLCIWDGCRFAWNEVKEAYEIQYEHACRRPIDAPVFFNLGTYYRRTAGRGAAGFEKLCVSHTMAGSQICLDLVRRPSGRVTVERIHTERRDRKAGAPLGIGYRADPRPVLSSYFHSIHRSGARHAQIHRADLIDFRPTFPARLLAERGNPD